MDAENVAGLEAERDRLAEALRELAVWGEEREKHSAASDFNQDEERGWNLALSGLEYRARAALASALIVGISARSSAARDGTR